MMVFSLRSNLLKALLTVSAGVFSGLPANFYSSETAFLDQNRSFANVAVGLLSVWISAY